jgi:flagellar biosynthesis activator protein FlaF
MQYPIADLSLPSPVGAGPAGAGSIYGKIIRDTERPREFELRIFEQITTALEAAAQPGTHFTARIAAMHRNRELWLTLTSDLMEEGNMLPKQLRASLISLGLWVTNETNRAMLNNTTSLDALIEVNRSIIRGLATASAGAS